MIFLYKKNIQTRYSFDCLMARIQKSWESCSGSRPLLASRECHKVSSESIMLLITKAQIFTKRGNLIAKKHITISDIHEDVPVLGFHHQFDRQASGV